jgi:ribosomal protein S18 acetylase RimI-like enzyme
MSQDLQVRVATAADSSVLAQLLHDFNTEFDTPSPGPSVLAAKLEELLSTDGTFAVLAGPPPSGVALVTLRTNVWHAGPVALLDELYVSPQHRDTGIGTRLLATVFEEAARRSVDYIEVNVDEGDVDALRFYRRHGFVAEEPDTGERALYLFREGTQP